ncbi:uncharacterized protein N7477_004939 [Penicillium maclennaniae]|uniref:uncharacterized protein n=1 Tax=Penicillium maclennaniae TaxID=1343394 RepID=UPI00253F864C|nr:uncharacterized protein N7477_004939 [Penicillium maclennaniae]KAJ5675005.1 hypothetical protein N7477_004939 [Penicillium maclennaniae]
MIGLVSGQSYVYSLQNDMMEGTKVINYYEPDLVPVTNAIAEDYLLFDRCFASIPGPADPNRAYLTSGISHGHSNNEEVFCNSGMPQKSVFEQLRQFHPDTMFYEWTAKFAKDKILPLSQLYKDAQSGYLPQFTAGSKILQFLELLINLQKEESNMPVDIGALDVESLK